MTVYSESSSLSLRALKIMKCYIPSGILKLFSFVYLVAEKQCEPVFQATRVQGELNYLTPLIQNFTASKSSFST